MWSDTMLICCVCGSVEDDAGKNCCQIGWPTFQTYQQLLKKIPYLEWSPLWHTILTYSGTVTSFLTYHLDVYMAYRFWHSIWHTFWHNIFWHSFWQSFWHSIWHLFWHSIWHRFMHSFWQSIWHLFSHSIWHLFYSIWHLFSHSIWHLFWHFFLHSFWHIFWHCPHILSGILTFSLACVRVQAWPTASRARYMRDMAQVYWRSCSSLKI